MPEHDIARRRRAAPVRVCAVAAASLAVTSSAGRLARSRAPAAAGEHCAFAHATPRQAGARRPGAALRCLVNRQRRRRGIAPMRHGGELDRVARRFAEDMRTRGYFGHSAPNGAGVGERTRTGHMRALGEVLAWGCGRLCTPAAAVRAWLTSPAPRRVVLSRAYTVIGTGVADGTPGRPCRAAASTSVALLGGPR